MVGVINANANTSLVTQIELAREEDYMLLPGEPFPNEQVEASLSRLAHSATMTTQIFTATASSQSSTSNASGSASEKTSNLSSGAVAGVAIGAAILALVLAALFFLMRRTRSLKRKLELKNAASKDENWAESATFSTRPTSRVNNNPTRQNSQLPPYRPYYHLQRPDLNQPTRIRSLPVENTESIPMSPVSPQSPLEMTSESPEYTSSSRAQWPM